MLKLLTRVDLMVRMLILAIILATVLPATGSAREAAQFVSNIGIFVLFFLNGVRLSRGDVANGIGNWRLLVPLVLWCFGAMALAGWCLWGLSAAVLPSLVALGFLYLGVLPSTVQSATAYTSLAGGNVASSVVSAALLNILGVFVSAAVFAWFSGGTTVHLGPEGLIKIFTILLLPFALGQILQSRLKGLLASHPQLIGWMDRIAIAIAVYVAFSGAVEQDLWRRLNMEAWSWLIILIAFTLLFAFVGAWMLSRAIRLSKGDSISFTFAGAHKSIAMGAPLALVMFSADDAGLILVPLLIYHLLQLVVSAPLANYWATRQN
ncbi:bile acid:sodium symporter [Altererythrobacter aestiaquae]|uniref:Bile acid:sodium symporter n=2 Tax=Pontixanthobacter aestiaquae TaxID=1509367 RepID=A0A844Z6A6_9SPHN|nr:bile acid:sodium symporter family protein [Pontixanthobacter aestiaquae]MXO83445.1 bile acid:sodium symporter [Pontixanthobacter aestiaquae]